MPEERPSSDHDDDLIYRVAAEHGVEKKFRDASIENIPENQRAALMDFFKGRGYYLYGDTGPGKTYIACALVNEIIRRFLPKYGPHVRYPMVANAEAIQNEIFESYKPAALITTQQVIENYSGYKVLIIDDLGVTKKNEKTDEHFYSIINNRYNAMFQTVVTSNLSLDQLRSHMGDRIASRLSEMCKVIRMTGPDRRLQS